MLPEGFSEEDAKKFLASREEKWKTEREIERKLILEKTLAILKKEFAGSAVEVYLVGSVLRPYEFSSRSDVDIVLKNYHGDRFDLWTKLETEIGRKVEIIPFETCNFKEFVSKEGLRVI